MVGTYHASEISLGLAPSDPDRLIRALRVFIDVANATSRMQALARQTSIPEPESPRI